MRIEPRPFDDPEATALRAELEADVVVRYGHDNEPGVKPSAGDVAVFLVAVDDGVALGGGGLRLLGEGAAEIKRMWVRPAARGRGVARALLAALEDEARSRGVTRMKIETGDRQHEAMALYERAGYARCPCWGAYAEADDSVCFTRPLTSSTV